MNCFAYDRTQVDTRANTSAGVVDVIVCGATIARVAAGVDLSDPAMVELAEFAAVDALLDLPGVPLDGATVPVALYDPDTQTLEFADPSGIPASVSVGPLLLPATGAVVELSAQNA